MSYRNGHEWFPPPGPCVALGLRLGRSMSTPLISRPSMNRLSLFDDGQALFEEKKTATA
jgi:hypothetical protein